MRIFKMVLGCLCVVWALSYLPDLRWFFVSGKSAYEQGRTLGAAAGFLLATALAIKLFQRNSESQSRPRFRSGLVEESNRSGWTWLAALLAGVASYYFVSRTLHDRPPISVEAAQQEAVRRYPELGISGSTQNRQFLKLFNTYKRERPEVFQNTSWPLRIAEESAKATDGPYPPLRETYRQ